MDINCKIGTVLNNKTYLDKKGTPFGYSLPVQTKNTLFQAKELENLCLHQFKMSFLNYNLVEAVKVDQIPLKAPERCKL